MDPRLGDQARESVALGHGVEGHDRAGEGPATLVELGGAAGRAALPTAHDRSEHDLLGGIVVQEDEARSHGYVEDRLVRGGVQDALLAPARQAGRPEPGQQPEEPDLPRGDRPHRRVDPSGRGGDPDLVVLAELILGHHRVEGHRRAGQARPFNRARETAHEQQEADREEGEGATPPHARPEAPRLHEKDEPQREESETTVDDEHVHARSCTGTPEAASPDRGPSSSGRGLLPRRSGGGSATSVAWWARPPTARPERASRLGTRGRRGDGHWCRGRLRRRHRLRCRWRRDGGRRLRSRRRSLGAAVGRRARGRSRW